MLLAICMIFLSLVPSATPPATPTATPAATPSATPTAAPSGATDEWAKSYNVESTPKLHVETSDANIRVTAWDKPIVNAHITTEGWKIGDGGINIIDHQSGDQVDIEVRFPHRRISVTFSHHSVDIEINVPRNANLDLHTGDGHVDLQGVSGTIALRSGDGKLTLSELQGTLQANTGDGDIDMRNVRGDMTLHTGDGRIELTGVDGSLRAETGDGRIRVNGRFDLLDVKTGDGGIEAEAITGSKLEADWRLSTGDGDLTLRLPQTIAADVELHTSDGNIDLGVPVTVMGRTNKREIHGQLNGGGKLLSMHTSDGSIRLVQN